MGHGALGVCALGAAGLLPPGVAFAICPGDGEAMPVRCPGGGDAFGEPALAGEVPGAVAGGVPDEGDAACAGAGKAAALAGAGDSSGAGARAPMFARSWPIRIFPRNTGRSKM